MEKNESRLDFDRIAKRYDRFNHLSSAGIDHLWRRQAVRKMPVCKKVLDVAVGTGDLAIEIVKRGKAEEVIGLDLSTEMMRVGAEKARRKGLEERISFIEGSALKMPFPDNSFDAVTCAYGIRNFSQLAKGLQEFQRVLKPGGQLIILEFSYPQNRFVAWCYDIYFKYFMTFLGRMMTQDKAAFRYFYASVKGFIWGEEMTQQLKLAGFTNPCYQTQTFGISTLYTANK